MEQLFFGRDRRVKITIDSGLIMPTKFAGGKIGKTDKLEPGLVLS
jgi:hypothetical protein